MEPENGHDPVAEFRKAVEARESVGLTRKYIAAVSSFLDSLEAAVDTMGEVSAIAREARDRDLNSVEHEGEAIELNELMVRTEDVLDRLSERTWGR